MWCDGTGVCGVIGHGGALGKQLFAFLEFIPEEGRICQEVPEVWVVVLLAGEPEISHLRVSGFHRSCPWATVALRPHFGSRTWSPLGRHLQHPIPPNRQLGPCSRARPRHLLTWMPQSPFPSSLTARTSHPPPPSPWVTKLPLCPALGIRGKHQPDSSYS